MRQAAIGFDSKKASLEGILTTPQELPTPYPALVICHAHPMLSGSMNAPLISAITRAADKLGIATMRFNFRGVEGSGGEFSNGDKEQQDVKSALNVMKRWPGMNSKRIALVGYSFGAGVILNGLRHYKAASSLALISPPLTALQKSRITNDKRPKLFLVGQNDRVTSSVELQGQLDRVREPVQFREIPNTDHSLRGHEQEVAEAVAEFVMATLS